jgi:hypothetical protein
MITIPLIITRLSLYGLNSVRLPYVFPNIVHILYNRVLISFLLALLLYMGMLCYVQVFFSQVVLVSGHPVNGW